MSEATPQDQQTPNPKTPPARPPQEQNPGADAPSTGTWLKLDARDPEAEAAEAAYLKESARVRRGVWIGNCVAFVLVGGALAGLGYVLIPKLGRPAAATAAEFVGDDEQRTQAVALLAKLNGAATMFKLQHYDRMPDFVRFPDWEQLLNPTDVNGTPFEAGKGSAGPVCGPYVQGKPVNPINGLSAVWVSDGEVLAGAPVGAGKAVGFVFHPAKMKFFVTNAAGTHVTDPSGPREQALGRSQDELAREQQATDAELTKALETFRAKLEQYQREHNGNLPDFEQYPGWDQLVERTDAMGRRAESGQFGPYVERPLKNPYTGTARVQVVQKHPGLRFTATSRSVAYVLDKSSGKVWAVDSAGQLMPSK